MGIDLGLKDFAAISKIKKIEAKRIYRGATSPPTSRNLRRLGRRGCQGSISRLFWYT